MHLVVGLGNPGKEYEKTRHNVGFSCVDALREKLALTDWTSSKKLDGVIAEGQMNETRLILLKPQTFMNNSGESVAAASQFYKIKPENLWVVYDDIDLPLGKLRLRKEGSAGTHNGMKSLITHLGFSDFPRLRIGIESRGVHAASAQDLSSFVLSKFLPEEEEIFQKTLKIGVSLLEAGVTEGFEKALALSTKIH